VNRAEAERAKGQCGDPVAGKEKTMKAVVRREVGAVPHCEEFGEPTPEDGYEVAEVLAAGLNKVDLVIAAGIHLPLPLPSVAGREGIVRMADGRRGYVYFDDVSGIFGSMAERTLVDPAGILPVPGDIDPPSALAAASTGLAAWVPLTRHAGLRPGESVLVLGATGPVGRLAVQLAKRLGAGHVVAAARSEQRLRALLEHGADAIVVMGGDDDEAALRQAAPGPYDVVVDYVFGPAFESALPVTNPGDPEVEGAGGSRYVVVGEFELGRKVRVGIESFFGLTIKGHQNSAVSAQERRAVLENLWSIVMAGELWIETEEVPIDQASDAWVRLGQGAHVKMALIP
jgi:NADPH:quinone reductase-like Zn-dependent oxidoreductase